MRPKRVCEARCSCGLSSRCSGGYSSWILSCGPCPQDAPSSRAEQLEGHFRDVSAIRVLPAAVLPELRAHIRAVAKAPMPDKAGPPPTK